MQIQDKAKSLLLQHNINTDSKIEFDVSGSRYFLSFEEIIDNYMQASTQSQEIFYVGLESALRLGEEGVEKFFEGMGQLLLMSHLSEKFES